MRIFLLFFIFFTPFLSQDNPREYFDDDYEDAIKFVKRKSNRINSIIEEWDGDKAVIYSIVFPELIRYSMWQDMLETKANELLYVRKGRPAAYFSIGRFQLKPTFAEKVEKTIKKNPVLAKKYSEIYTFDDYETRARRAERIERLKSYKWQVKYVTAFSKIVEDRFSFGPSITPQQKIRLFSSAYNHDFLCDSMEMIHWSTKKHSLMGSRGIAPFLMLMWPFIFMKMILQQ